VQQQQQRNDALRTWRWDVQVGGCTHLDVKMGARTDTGAGGWSYLPFNLIHVSLSWEGEMWPGVRKYPYTTWNEKV
jgi:hypothetical protein